MTLIWRFKVTKGQTDYAIRSATYDLLLVFYNNFQISVQIQIQIQIRFILEKNK